MTGSGTRATAIPTYRPGGFPTPSVAPSHRHMLTEFHCIAIEAPWCVLGIPLVLLAGKRK
jgi:hypothetical protein